MVSDLCQRSLLILAVALIPFAAACTAGPPTEAPEEPPAVETAPEAADEEAPPAGGSRTRFLRKMFATDQTSFGDAARLVQGLIEGATSADGDAAVIADLESRGVVDAGWGLKAEDKLTKGVLAYMLVRALEIEGGLTMQVLGVTRRYALREASHRGLVWGRYPQEFVTGRELIDVMQRATVYQQEGSLDSLLR